MTKELPQARLGWALLALSVMAVLAASNVATAAVFPTQKAHFEDVASAYACDGRTLRPDLEKPRPHYHGGEIAFWGHRAVVACGADDDDVANDGLSVIDIRDPERPVTLSTFRCVGSASDVAVWGDLVFLAADSNNTAHATPQADPRRPYAFPGPVVGTGRLPCEEEVRDDPPVDGAEGAPTFFRGVRIVSIADPRNPQFVTHVETRTSAGAHNLTVVPDVDHPDADGEPTRLLVFVADPAGPTRIVRVPIGKSPEQTRDETKLLWTESSELGKPSKSYEAPCVPGGTDETSKCGPAEWWSENKAEGNCHDISFFMPRRLATCHKTGYGTAVLSFGGSASLLKPTRLDFIDGTLNAHTGRTGSVTNPAHELHHSGAFSWDGDKLVITDEHLKPQGVCGVDAAAPGAISIYDISNIDGSDPSKVRWTLAGRHASPWVAGPEICTSKQVNVVPLRSGRDIAVVSWYGAGTSMVDFTDPADTKEIAHFVAEPGTDDRSWTWASYWYDGRVYGSNVHGCLYGIGCFGTKTRGVDVLAPLRPELASAIKQHRFSSGLQECLRGVPPRAAVLTCTDRAGVQPAGRDQ